MLKLTRYYKETDILCVTRCMVSHYVDVHISPQLSVCAAFTRAVVH